VTGLDRRAVFFAVAGLVCLLLVPVTPDNLRWVGWLLAITFAVLSAASLLDDLSRRRHRGD
jgi:uncharacterized membrane protein YeiB